MLPISKKIAPALKEIKGYEQFLRLRIKATKSFHEFVKQAWPCIEGNKQFVDGWHIMAICEHLQAVADRQIKNLIINIPPRCGKSSIISVAFPAWVWISQPDEQFLYTSYAKELAVRDSVKCRRLILSPWYQKNWRHVYSITTDQNTKGRFQNNKCGYRLTTSVGSATTGEGGNFLIADDPNDGLDYGSEVNRESKIEWLDQIWSTRLNDKRNDCQVVIQQRIHERDITGYISSHDDLNEWTKLILPMEFEESRRTKTIVLPSSDGDIWTDPRQAEGDLLWPERIGAKELASIKQGLKSEARIAGQLQQRPSAPGGNIIKKSWFKLWKSGELPRFEFIIQSWDTALTSNDTSSYSACTTWGVFYNEFNFANVMLLSVWRDKLTYPSLREMAKRLSFDYRDAGKVHNPSCTGRQLDMCLIEAKSSGDPLIHDLLLAGIRATPFIPKSYSKEQRVHLISYLVENGLVWLQTKSPNFDTILHTADIFCESVASFPTGESDDLIDTMTQMLFKLTELRLISHSRDVQHRIQPSVKDIKIY